MTIAQQELKLKPRTREHFLHVATLRRWRTIQDDVDRCRTHEYFAPDVYATAITRMARIHVRRLRAVGSLANTAARAGSVLMALLLLAGCSGIGPGTVTRDRFDYTAAVAESWKSQMLLNLVKMRYGDTPVFLDVGQIVTGYTVQSTFSAAGSIFNTNTVVPGVPNSSIGLGAQGQFTDRPTITYAPLVGERFARSMMMPIPPSAILNVIQAGFPLDVVFRLAVQAVNGVDNRRVQLQHIRPANPEFYVLLQDLRRLQTSGDIGVRRQRVDRDELLTLVLRPHLAAAVENALLNALAVLGLDPAAREFRVVYGAVAANDKEIALLSRSIREVLVDLSSVISVPEAHVTERRVGPTPEADLGPEGPVPPLIRIACSPDRPRDAFVAAPYRGHWFSIDDRDMPSKHVFSFLMFLFTFVETESKEATPILTIPTQ